MTAPTSRRVAALGLAAAAVVGTGVAVALTRPDPARPPTAASAATTASGVAPTPSPSPSTTASASASPTAVVTVPTARPPQGRLTGPDRYATSVQASRAAFPGSAHAPVVFLVSGQEPAKGFAAVPAAAVGGGPVLLVRRDGIPAVTARELDRLSPQRIVVVGGTAALGRGVERAAARHARVVQRVDGGGADGASLALARAAFPTATRAWVVADGRPEHAVVAAAAAAATRSPLLVVDRSAAHLPAAHADLLRDLGVGSVVVVGSTSAVSTTVAEDLGAVVGADRVTRATGPDRYALAVAVNALGWPRPSRGVAYLANGREPTSAFAAASLAGLSKRPLYYSLPYCVPAAVRPALVAGSVQRVVLVGGESSLRRLAGRLVGCRSIDDMTSDWVLVNRSNPLSPKTFTPPDLIGVPMSHAADGQLRADAARALGRMASAVAGSAGRVGIDTAYRSYATQDSLYDTWLARRGRSWTDTWYARPGYSEHQTGLTVDLLPVGERSCTINDCIDETPQGRWLAENSWRYGYILRYEKGFRSTVGLGYEPWHFRYVGAELARAYHDGGWHTLEAFLDEPAAPSY